MGRKHCGKRRNCSLRAISPFSTVFSRVVMQRRKNQGLFGKGLTNNFKFDQSGRNLSKQVENTMEKGEIARYEQFLFFPQCFQKAYFPGASKGVIVWEWVNPLPNNKILDRSKLKALAEDKINVTEKLKFVLGRVENMVEKRRE